MVHNQVRRPHRWQAHRLAENRFGRVLLEAAERKKWITPLQRPSFADEFFRDNPMPWLLDSSPCAVEDDGDAEMDPQLTI